MMCAAAVGALLGAQDFTLQEAAALAAANNTDLLAAKRSLEQARRDSRYSWNALLPSLSLSGGLSHTHAFDGGGSADPSWSASGGIDLTLSAGVASQMRLASLAYQAQEAAYLEAERALIARVSTDFYQLLADKENITILKDALALAQNQYDETKRKHGRGLASELDLLNAEYTWRTAGPAVDDAERAYAISLARFRVTIGLDREAARSPAGDVSARLLALPDADTLAARYAGQRSDVKQALLAVETAKANVTLKTLSDRAPTLRLAETLALRGGAGAEPAANGTFSLTLSVPLSAWLPVSTNGLAIRTLKEKVEGAEEALAAARVQAALDIREKVDAAEQAAERRESASLNYRIANRAYELSRQGYNSGLVSQTDLLEARQRMVSARQAVLQAEIAYTGAVYNLSTALGLSAEEVYTEWGT
jgi:multidrug efflux system outer membrane protein